LEIKNYFSLPYNPRYKVNPFGSVYLFTLGKPLWNQMMKNYDGSMPRKRIIVYRKKGCPRVLKNIPLADQELEMLGKEISAKKIGEMFGMAEHTVCKVFKRRGIGIGTKHFFRFNPTKEQLEQELKDCQYNFSKVSRGYGVSDTAIRKRCRKFGISWPRYPQKGRSFPVQ
jgi:hypothetical protein